jgi:hypothetical protein
LYAQYATPLRIELRASRQAALWLLPVHVSAGAVLPFTSLPVWGQVACMLAIAASLAWHWSRHVSRRRSPLRALVWQTGSDCALVRADGTTQAGTLAPRAFVMPWLVIVYYRQGARQHSLFILPDMLPADTFRRLRVRLKTELGQARPTTRTCSRTS